MHALQYHHHQAPTGGSHAAYAGKEVARALAKDSLDSSDLGSAELSGCSEAELQRLEQQLAHIKATYDEVGKVCALRVCVRG